MKFWILFLAAILMSCFVSAQNQRFLPVKQGGKTGLIDTAGAVVLNPEFDAIHFLDSRIFISVEKGGKQAIFNMITHSFSTDYYFFAEVVEPNLFKVGDGKLSGLVDDKRQLLIPIAYNTIEMVGGSRIVCSNSAGVDVFDRQGSIRVHFDMNNVSYFEENYIIQHNDSFGFASEDGQILVQPRWEKYLLNYEVVCFKNPDSVLCYYSPTKTFISGSKKTSIQFFYDFDSNPIALPFYIESNEKTKKLFSVYRKKPSEIDFEDSYIRSTPLSGYYILKNEYNFLIDSMGTNLIPRAFDAINYLGGRQFTVVDNGLKGVYDLDSGFVVNPEYYDLSTITDSVTKRKWIFALTENGWTLLNPDFSKVNGFYFRSLRLHDGVGFVAFPNSGLGLLLDIAGKPMCQPKYASFSLLKNGLWKAQTYDGVALLAPNGKELLPPEYKEISERGNTVRTVKNGVAEMYEWKNNQLVPLAVYNNYRRLTVSGRNDDFSSPVQSKRAIYKWQKDSVSGNIGLWNIIDEEYKIAPIYNYARPDRINGLSLVGVYGDTTRFSLGPLSFVGIWHFGIVDHNTGRIVAPTNFAFIYFSQFMPHFDENDNVTRFYMSDRNLAMAISDSGKWCSISITGLVVRPEVQFIDRFRGSKAKVWKFDSAYVAPKSKDMKLTNIGRFNDGIKTFLRPADAYTDSVVKNGERSNLYAHRADSLLFYKNAGGPNGKIINSSLGLSPPAFVYPYIYKEILGASYWEFYNFSVFKPDRKYSFVDEQGVMIAPLEFTRAYDFSDNRALVKRNGKYGFIDPNGNMVIEEKFKKAMPFSEGLAVASVKGGKMGYIDTDGNWAIDPVYKDANPFHQGLAAVKPQNLYGFINSSGQMVIEPAYLRAFDFQSGTAVVYLKKGYGLINEQGEYVLKAGFDKILPADDQGMRLAAKKSRFSMVAPNGLIVVKKARHIAYAGDGYYSVRKGSKQILVDASGKEQGSFVSQTPIKVGENLVLAYSKGKFNYFSFEGEKVLGTYSKATPFSNERAIVSHMQKTFIIDKDGKEKHCIFTSGASKAEPFDSNGYAFVRRSDHYFLIDTSGVVWFNSLSKPKRSGNLFYMYIGDGQQMIYDATTKRSRSMGYWNSMGGVCNDRLLVGSEGLYGFADLCAKYYVKPQYTRIVKWNSTIYQIHYGDKIGYIRKDGSIIWDITR